MALNLTLVKKRLVEQYNKYYVNLKIDAKEVTRRIKLVLDQELQKPQYRENFVFDDVDYNYLKPSETLVSKAFKFLKEKYLEVMSSGNPHNYITWWNIYYSYTVIRNGAVIRYQFNYFIDSKNRSIIGAEGNQFNLLIVYDYKNSRGIWNERLQYNGMAGYVYRPTYHGLINPYHYDKKHDEGGMRWGYYEYAPNYKKLKINKYFSIGVGERNPYSSQRILELNPNHVEMLYKLGYSNLWNRRMSDKKVEFLKKHMKELRKNITINELSKAYALHRKGLKLKELDNILWFMNDFTFYPYKFDFDYKKKSQNYSYSKGTTTEDLNKLIRMMNITKEHGMEHLIMCRGVCYYFDMDFESFIFKGLKERQGVIDEWKELKHQYELKQRRERDKEVRRRKKEAKLRAILFEDFCQKNKVVYEKIADEEYIIKQINDIEMDRKLNTSWHSIAEIYEEEKEMYEFKKENTYVVEKEKNGYMLLTVNGKEINRYLSDNDPKAVKRIYDQVLYEERIAKTTLEDVTKNLREIKMGGFIFTPLRTMKDFQEIQDQMELCLMRNEYYQKVKGGKIFMYIAHLENQERTNGEVIEFIIKNKTITPGQISGYNNKSTPNYDAIKQLASQMTMDQLIQKGA